MLKKAVFSPPPNPDAQDAPCPRQGRSERRGEGGTYRTSCGPFALAMGLGERKNPFSHSLVEPLSDARTLLADFFSILLSPHKHDRGKQDGQRKNEREASDPGRPQNQGVIGPASALRGEL